MEIQTVTVISEWLDSLDSFIESVTIYSVQQGPCRDVLGYITITLSLVILPKTWCFQHDLTISQTSEFVVCVWHPTKSECSTRPFYCGEELRLMCGRGKNIWPHWHSINEVPQMPSNKTNPAKQVKSRVMAPWD